PNGRRVLGFRPPVVLSLSLPGSPGPRPTIPHAENRMDRRNFLTSVAAGAVGGLAATGSRAAAQPAPAPVAYDKKDVEAAVERGLEYLKREQKQGGHWEAPNGMYPTAMTALAGMTFLMEGSTLRTRKYTDQINAAVKWLRGG